MTQTYKFAFCILLAAAAYVAPAARADESDQETVVTFNQPVEVPGKVLAAGTYVFKLADSNTNRNIVQIYTKDQQHLLATVMAIPEIRPEPTGKTVITFEERKAGSPEALRSWFYPGETTGLQFQYANSEQHLAANTAQPAPRG